MNSSDISIAFHVSSIGFRSVSMMCMDRVLVGIEAVGGMKSHPARPLFFVYLLRETVDKEKNRLKKKFEEIVNMRLEGPRIQVKGPIIFRNMRIIFQSHILFQNYLIIYTHTLR